MAGLGSFVVRHKEVGVIEKGTVLGPAVRRELVVDTELGSVRERDLHSLAEEGTDFDNHPVVVHSLVGEDIDLGPGRKEVAVADRKEPAGHTELVDRKRVAGDVVPDLRNSRCLT
jgi:hypothetical protein